MRHIPERRSPRRTVVLLAGVLVASVAFSGCKKLHQSDMTPLNQAGMDFSSLDQLRKLGISDGEVSELIPVRQSGMSDDGCLQLVQLAHDRHQTFTEGQGVAGLLGAGFHQDSVLELAKLNQLGLWTGEAEALRLSGLSDQLVLAVARRRAAGETVLSSAKIAALKNSGLSESQIVTDIDGGMTDAQADRIIAERNYDASGHGFVRARRRHR